MSLVISKEDSALAAASWTTGHDLVSAGPAHLVQFYEKEEFLYAEVANFLADGLIDGDRVIVIATEPHRLGFITRVEMKGIDVDEACGSGQLTLLDAREVLSTFMSGGMPDEQRFAASLGMTISASLDGDASARVRAYGEMVDLLWRDGNPEAAIRLEEIWNDLAKTHAFSLLCAYPMGSFYKEAHAHQFEDICRHHARVIPAETFTPTADETTRWREITLLQQRAASLEAEVNHRRELEAALREALAERRRAEVALRRSERELKDFVENATVGLHWVGPDGTILWANDAELTLLGYAREEYVGHHMGEFYADGAVLDDILSRLAANEEIHDFEARLVAKDGSIKHVAITSNVYFEDGTFIHTRCFTRDITEQKRLEAEARRANEDNVFLLEATTVLTRSLEYDARLRGLASVIVPRLADWCTIDMARGDGTYEQAGVTHADPEMAEILQRLGESHPVPPEVDPILRVLQTGEPEIDEEIGEDDLESLVPNPDHRLDLQQLGFRSRIIVPMVLMDRVLGTISFFSATSGRYSNADLPLTTELARRAAITVENARLYQMAQQANRTKDEFLATLSHELRTPLTAIFGWARMLTLGALDADTMRTAYETIERSARTQAALIDDLLDLSRVVTGKLSLRSELVDLASVVTGAVQTIGLAAEAKGVRVEVTASAERAIVTGDPTRLQQIVWNLLSNAIKFSDAGGSVSVSVERATDDVRVVVRDNGRGIPVDFLSHVFEPFRQADGASTRSHGGLGLGLAIVKYLTELHGGTVTANSKGIGTGATFVVTLPLALRRSSHVDAVQSEEMVDLGGTSVLLVDDDADSRDVLTTMLERCGAKVAAVDSVRNAWNALGNKTPDVILTDLAMPEEDGFALLRDVRAGNDAMRDVPVVALTAFDHPEAKERLRAAGFQAYVRKPIDPLDLARVVAGAKHPRA